MSKLFKDYGKIIALVLGILAGVFLMLDAFVIGNADEATKGMDIIFGAESTFIGITAKFKFNILLFLAFLLPIAAGLLGILLDSKSGALLGLILFVGSIALLLTTTQTSYVVSALGSSITTDVEIGLAVLGFVSVALSGLGALTNVGILIENN